MEILVGEIKKEGGKHGMKLNKDKCEALATAQNEDIQSSDNTIIKVKHEVTYLGCMINQKANTGKQIHKKSQKYM